MTDRASRHQRIRRAATALIAFAALLFVLSFIFGDASSEEREPQGVSFAHLGSEVEVRFHAEISSDELFGPGVNFEDLVSPVGSSGAPEGRAHEPAPAWLLMEYRIGDYSRTVLIPKKPLMNEVSWNAIARAGAAMGDGSIVRIGAGTYPQDAEVTALDGRRYKVRLMRCGRSTTAPFSEWNLLIGGIHEGDVDFDGERYGWLTPPYTDTDLKVGYNGSLNWCRDQWHNGRPERVTRGYFNVSRFHATSPAFRGQRIYWRPLLELIDNDSAEEAPEDRVIPEVSPNRAVSYFGRISYESLFGDEPIFERLVQFRDRNIIGGGRPDWLKFTYRGKELLVAARPVGHSVSWDDLAKAGVVTGDSARIRVGVSSYSQDATIEDTDGNSYRLRLLECGKSTLDHSSEWNALLGGVHQGDGDFIAAPDGIYGWLGRPLTDRDLYLNVDRGGASWCKEVEERAGRRFAVNRGYMTVSRYHSTVSNFTGYGFAWRPVLEKIEAGR